MANDNNGLCFFLSQSFVSLLEPFPNFWLLAVGKQLLLYGKVKGKAVPLQLWSGPECTRKLRFPYYMTTAQDGGKVVSLTHRPPLPPRNNPGTHFC